MTGSCHYLQVGKKKFLVDCGMEQGIDRFENADMPVPASEIDFVFLTHAHIDHSGMLPYTTVNGAGVVRDDNLVIYVKVADRPSVKEGMEIIVNGHKTVVREISPEPVQVSEEVGEYVLDVTGLKSGDWTYMVEADIDLPDGVYEASITVESVHPIKFVTN